MDNKLIIVIKLVKISIELFFKNSSEKDNFDAKSLKYVSINIDSKTEEIKELVRKLRY